MTEILIPVSAKKEMATQETLKGRKKSKTESLESAGRNRKTREKGSAIYSSRTGLNIVWNSPHGQHQQNCGTQIPFDLTSGQAQVPS